MCDEFVEAEGSADEVLPTVALALVVLSLGFFAALGPSLAARAALSLETIFA